MEGWIKLHRKFISWEWYTDVNTQVLFLHLLLTASSKDSKFRGTEIKRGQLLTGLLLLSRSTGISIQSVRTALEHLKSTNEITIQSTHRFSVITICKYDDYQTIEKPTNKRNNKQTNFITTSHQQSPNNIQESKEGEEYKESVKHDFFPQSSNLILDFDQTKIELSTSDNWKIELMREYKINSIQEINSSLETFLKESNLDGKYPRSLSNTKNHFRNILKSGKKYSESSPAVGDEFKKRQKELIKTL